MTGAVAISWGAPVRGRETKGLEVFSKAIAYYEHLAKQGRIHSHKEYFAVSGNTSKPAGFMFVEGLLDELYRIQSEPETLALLTEAQMVVDNLSVKFFAGGTDRSVQERVTQYMEALQALGFA